MPEIPADACMQVEEVVRHDGEQLQEDVHKMLRLLDVALNDKVSGRQWEAVLLSCTGVRLRPAARWAGPEAQALVRHFKRSNYQACALGFALLLLPCQVTAWLPKAEIAIALRAFFSHKSPDRLQVGRLVVQPAAGPGPAVARS